MCNLFLGEKMKKEIKKDLKKDHNVKTLTAWRIDPALRIQFNTVCGLMGIKPGHQIESIMQTWVDKNISQFFQKPFPNG
jgi:hypothetical protein